MSVVPPPELDGKASDAFRIADVRSSSATFLQQVAGLLASHDVQLPLKSADLSAADLRLPSSEDLLHRALADPPAVQPTPPAAPPATQAAPPSASPPGTSNDAPVGLEDSKTEKERVARQYALAAEAVRQQQAAEHTAALHHLRSLQAADKMGESAPPPSDLLRQNPSYYAPVQQPPTPADPSSAAESEPTNGTNGTVISPAQARPDAPAGAQPVPPGEIVIRIVVHLPQAPARAGEEWLVLGSQHLTELRDVLYCLTEVNLKNVEAEERRKRGEGAPELHLSKPSAYFYFEGTFFVDSRHPESKDYSQVIIKYNMDHGVRAPPHPPPGPASAPLGAPITDFSHDAMEDRRFEDLWVRLGAGAPGLFCHQGGCEHVVVIKDVRVHNPDADPPLVSQYPFKIGAPGAWLQQYKSCEVSDVLYFVTVCCMNAAVLLNQGLLPAAAGATLNQKK